MSIWYDRQDNPMQPDYVVNAEFGIVFVEIVVLTIKEIESCCYKY